MRSSTRAIATSFDFPKSMVQDTAHIDRVAIEFKDLPRSGTPKTYTHVDYRNILRFVLIPI